MAFKTTYPGQINIGDNPEDIVFGTAMIGDEYGEVKSASVKRAADMETITKYGSIIATVMQNARFELTLETTFRANVQAPGIGERIHFPMIGLNGFITGVDVKWEEKGARGLSISATRWDTMGANATAKWWDPVTKTWKPVVDTVAVAGEDAAGGEG